MPELREYEMIWFWRKQPVPGRAVDRKGQRCRVLVRGGMNSVLVEFEDGLRVVTSRYAIRKTGKDQARGQMRRA